MAHLPRKETVSVTSTLKLIGGAGPFCPGRYLDAFAGNTSARWYTVREGQAGEEGRSGVQRLLRDNALGSHLGAVGSQTGQRHAGGTRRRHARC